VAQKTRLDSLHYVPLAAGASVKLSRKEMDISYFSYITGLASLFGFVAQVMDWFPGHKELRKSVFLVLIGVFLGSLASAFNTSSINFEFTISGFTLLIVVIGMLVLSLIFIAVFTKDSSKRNELYSVSGIASITFIFILFFGSLPNIDNESSKIRNEKSRLSIGELILISDDAISHQDYDRAIMHLQTVKSRLISSDPRYKKIEEKITEVKKMQL
jgi:glucan phosphoethanolaminetransferase (alkaline phosphatase superfamily)